MALYLQIAGSSSHTPVTLTAQLTSLKIGKVDGWMEEEGGGCRLPTVRRVVVTISGTELSSAVCSQETLRSWQLGTDRQLLAGHQHTAAAELLS